jgi:hypothetical protein
VFACILELVRAYQLDANWFTSTCESGVLLEGALIVADFIDLNL